jgi:hypothetical protein
VENSRLAGKGKPYGVRLSKDGLTKIRWRLDIRAWLVTDWAAKAEVDPRTVYRWMGGGHIERPTAAKLQQAFLDNPPIEGLAEILESEVVAS